NIYQFIQIALPPVEFFRWCYGFRRTAQKATIKRRDFETLKGSPYQRLETLDAVVFEENPKEMFYLGGSLVLEAFVRQVFSVDLIAVIGIVFEPVVRLRHNSLAGAAFGHDGQPHLLGFGEGSGINRIGDVLGQNAGSGTTYALQLVKLDSELFSDFDRRRVELWAASTGDATRVERVFHFSSCSAFSKIFLILSASCRFACM